MSTTGGAKGPRGALPTTGRAGAQTWWGRLVLVCVLYVAAVVALLVVWIRTVSSIVPLLPLLIRPAISVLFLGLLLLPSQWFFSVLTLAYLDLKGQGDAAVEG